MKKMENHLIEIVNRQRKIKIGLEILRDFTDRAVNEIAEASGKSLTIAFVSDRRMRQLNSSFRGVKSTTDVLSFPSEPDEFEVSSELPSMADEHLGDVVISLQQARKQASENNLDFGTEIRQLILHGILHLCGCDHETDDGEMNERELELRDKLEIM